VTTVRLKGINRVSKRLADGRRVTYYYAWKGGPPLEGKPGSPEFVRSYAKAHERRKMAPADTLGGLARQYRAAPEFRRLAKSTQAEWRRWLDRIEAAKIASLPIAALGERGVRVHLLAWRDTYADRPRAADYGAQVLGRVLGWAKGRGLLDTNHFEDVEQLHRSDRADVIWEDAELAKFSEHASPEVSRALRLACCTGLRRGDLIALAWEEVGDTAIVLRTRKNGAEATIPLLPEAKAILAEIGRGKGAVLRNTFGKPWSADGLENRIIKAKAAAGVNKRLHDARGTFVTRLRLAGVTRDEIAQIVGWKTARVERILHRYVDQGRFVRSIAERLAGKA
jgi:integrase